MAEQKWNYEKLKENGEVEYLPTNDSKGEITGKYIINLPAYFDEHPEERIRLGWIKHIHHNVNDVEYNKQTQYLQRTYKQIDAYTIEDAYEVFDKTEEMILLEELNDAIGYGNVTAGGLVFIQG